MTYQEGEALPKSLAVLGMILALLSPYVIAVAMRYSLPGLSIDVTGLITALVSIPLISAVVLPIAFVWYTTPYWHGDVDKTELSAIALLIIIAYPIAFTFSFNESLGIYFVGAMLIVVLLIAMLYDWEPLVPTSEGTRFGLTWASVVALIVLGITSLNAYLSGADPLAFLLMPFTDPRQWLMTEVLRFTTLAPIVPYLSTLKTMQIIPTVGFLAFVVGFSEEAWARLSIPQVAKYFDGNLVLAVWWLGTTWLSLHAPVIAYEIGLAYIPFNLLVLSLVSIFIFYVFAKTGDYVATAFAHGFYDLMVSLGLVGLVIAVVLLVITRKFRV